MSNKQYSDNAHKGFLSAHPLISFFILAYVFSWGGWIMVTALHLPWFPLFMIGTAGPTIAAFVMLSITSGKRGVLELLRSYVQWRVGIKWYLFTLVVFPLLTILTFVVMPGGLTHFVAPDWGFIFAYLNAFIYSLTLAGGPLLEEGGWRGYALPRLQKYYGPLFGTLILGIGWGLWHLPFYFGPLSSQPLDVSYLDTAIAFAEYLIGVIGVSFVMTWVFNNTGGSVLIAILLHACIDALAVFGTLFPSVKMDLSPYSVGTMGLAIVFSITALIIIIATKGQLGYQNNPHPE